ncbi:MAG: hypothetical protein WKF40_00800 [Thermoleophilaceae bacterium]
MEDPATLLIRPRGWHLDERHVEVDGAAVAGGLFDFALYFIHNARELLERGSGRIPLPAQDGVTTSRRGCGTAPSTWPRTISASSGARCAPRC